MAVRVWAEAEALDRLGELDLNVELVERAVRRAEAEASTCTPLDPPLMQGLIRWGRVTRFLREELVVLGWRFDNPRNVARTIHPSGQFAIVAAHGDESTGRLAQLPSTKHAKGDATSQAVGVNGQLMFDLGVATFGVHREAGSITLDDMLTWLLLFYVNDEEFRVELSLPAAIIDGQITAWAERIIMPSFPRLPEQPATPANATPDGQGREAGEPEEIVVEVNRR
jgi:hypothetical protein